jgi:hypothetical protein
MLLTKFKFTLPTFGALLSLYSVHPVMAQATIWPQGEDPNLFLYQDEKLDTDLGKLRMQATVTENGAHAPWSETYWPAKDGGIAARYDELPAGKKPGGEAFTAEHPSLADLKTMSADDIRKLSAAEKFDIANLHYDYPLTNRVLTQYKRSNPGWWGICHGWTPAAVNYPEPQAVTAHTRDGLTIEFGASDIKALISYYYAWEASQFDENDVQHWGFKNDDKGVSNYYQNDPKMVYFLYRQLGQRCAHGFLASGQCKETNMNPAAFHLALANLVGKYQRSFIVNVDPKKQVWNQPIYGYSSTVLDQQFLKAGDGPIAGATRKVLIHTTLTYVVESDPHYAPNGASVLTSKKELAYWLYVDGGNQVIGGEWSTGHFLQSGKNTDYIGFAWRASRVPFLGDFTVLNKLYVPASHKTTSYTMGRNYTPGLEDTYYHVNSSSINEF